LQTIITTWLPILIIGLFAFYFFRESQRLVRLTGEIGSLGTGDLLGKLSKTKLSDIASRYTSTIKIGTRDGDKTNYPASEYFSGDAISWADHINLRVLNAAPGMLVGLGLLGTFLGLTIGINDFKAGTPQEVMDSIQRLLPGMWMAFLTSVLGMVCSIAFTMRYKKVSNRFRKQLLQFTDMLDDAYYIDDISRLSGVIREQFDCRKEDGTCVPLGQAVREILTENEEQTKALKSFSSDLAVSFSGVLDDVLSRQMQDKIQPLLQSLVDHLDELGKKIQAPASDMVGAVVEDLKNSMTQVIDEFRKNLSGSATSELENLAKQLGSTSEAMAALPKDMENISSTLQTVIQDVKAVISDISNTNASDRNAAMEQMQEQIKFATSSISDAVDAVRNVMTQMTQSSQTSADDIMKKMSEAMEGMTQRLEDATGHISDSLKSNIGQIVGDMASKQAEMLEGVKAAVDKIAGTGSSVNESVMKSIDEAVRGMQDVMTQMTQSSQTSADDIMKKMSEAMEGMTQRLEDATGHISDALKSNIGQIVGDMAARQAEMLEGVKAAVDKIAGTGSSVNESVMKSIDEAIKGVKDVMGQVSESSLKASQDAINKMTEAAGKLDQHLDSALSRISGNVGGITDTMASRINELLGEIKNAMETISSASVKANEQVMKSIGEQVASATASVSEASRQVKETTAQITGSLLDSSQTAIKNMSDSADRIRGILENSAGIFSEAVKSKLIEMMTEITGKQKTILELQDNTVNRTQGLLNDFNQSLDHLDDTNDSIAGTMDMFRETHGQIAGSTAHLQTVAGDMKTAAEALDNSLSEYSNGMEQLQSSTQATVASAESLMQQSGAMSKEYAEQFETIRTGLASVFGQLQRGLTEYSMKVREMTGTFLVQYSNSLTDTADSLSGAIQQMSDLVEELQDTLDKNKR
jgi:uncharacterized phage infection (PIP) family protein YhgE